MSLCANEFITDGIEAEDLQSASDFYEAMVANELPQQRAVSIARDTYGVDLDDRSLNKILGRFACSLSTMEMCVRSVLQKGDFS